MKTRRSRTDILIACLAAFGGIQGNLSEAEVDYGMTIIETEYDGDLDAVQRDLRAEMVACSLACRVSERQPPMAQLWGEELAQYSSDEIDAALAAEKG